MAAVLFVLATSAVLGAAWLHILGPIVAVVGTAAGLYVAYVVCDLIPPLRDLIDFWGLDTDPANQSVQSVPARTDETVGSEQ